MPTDSYATNKSLWSSVGSGLTKIRNFTVNLIFLLVLIFVLISALSTCQSVSVPEQSALLLNPQGVIVETRSLPLSLLNFMPGGEASRETELESILTAIRRASDDDDIEMLMLDLENLTAISPAQANRIGDALASFKAQGKKVVSYGDYYSQSQYHIASFADEIYMHPYGQILFTGYGGSSFYLRDVLDRFKVNVHVFRVGEYKAAVEPMTRNSMSEESRMASERLYQDLWQHFVADVSANRAIPEHEVQNYADGINTAVAETKGNLARAALERHLIDELMTPDQVRVRVAATVGYSDPQATQLNAIDFGSYLAATEGSQPREGGMIDIITVQGAITLNGDVTSTANANVIAEMIHRSRIDPQTAAIVLRVDSPGGSQFGSELIRQELELAQLAGMPVVASFGSAAASGGYWIAATADEIVSEATSITGSIGIFSLLMTYENTLQDFGIHTDGVGTSVNTNGLSAFTGINDNMSDLFQAQVDHGYRQFLNIVAKGRDKSVADVEAIASGRVWSGEAALEVGLVDQVGGLSDAVERAASLAELITWQTRHRQQPIDPRSEFLAAISQLKVMSASFWSEPAVKLPINHAATPEFVVDVLIRQLRHLRWLSDPKHLLVMCTECILPSHDLGL